MEDFQRGTNAEGSLEAGEGSGCGTGDKEKIREKKEAPGDKAGRQGVMRRQGTWGGEWSPSFISDKRQIIRNKIYFINI
ncbi:MAG: hypothetical protein CSB33_00900 [Desulfobacterales bacterium]|nr:MAG: hypothetical protein CSB33_00900 [Desulfobacterales bacterium]